MAINCIGGVSYSRKWGEGLEGLLDSSRNDAPFGYGPVNFSMSSIKRDVKKKVLPRPEERGFWSRDPAHCLAPSRFCSRGFLPWPVCSFPRGHLPVVTTPIEF